MRKSNLSRCHVTILMFAAVGSAHFLVWATPSAAERRCISDYDCTRSAGMRNEYRCIGDTLIRRETRCVAGRCQVRETTRRNCAAVQRGRCVGSGYRRQRGRCDGLAGRCVTRSEIEVCNRSCVCHDNRLVLASGKCSPAIGCHSVVLQCPGGCTCKPEPKCLDGKKDEGERPLSKPDAKENPDAGAKSPAQ